MNSEAVNKSSLTILDDTTKEVDTLTQPIGCKISLTPNMVLCIPFFSLWGAYMILVAVMTPLSPADESYKILATVEKCIGIAMCVYVCIYSFMSITHKSTTATKKCLCFLLLATGIVGFFYLESRFLYFDLVLIISLICAAQKSEKDNVENENYLSRL